MSDVIELLGQLVAVDSTNPTLEPGGAGEAAVAALLADRLGAGGLEVDVWEAVPGAGPTVSVPCTEEDVDRYCALVADLLDVVLPAAG